MKLSCISYFYTHFALNYNRIIDRVATPEESMSFPVTCITSCMIVVDWE